MSRKLKKAILFIILTSTVGMLQNIAAGILPASWLPYTWIAWPLLLLFLLLLIVLEISDETGSDIRTIFCIARQSLTDWLVSRKRILAITIIASMLILGLVLARTIPSYCEAEFPIEDWTRIKTPFDDNLNNLVVNPKIPNLLFAGTLDGRVFRSEDGGINWVPVYMSLDEISTTAIAISAESPSTIYIGTDSAGILKSTDTGYNWSYVNEGLAFTNVRDILVDPQNHQTVYAATWGGGVFKSTNGGRIWSQSNHELTDLVVQQLAISINPRKGKILFAGTNDNGVFISSNEAESWSQTSLSSGDVRSLVVSPRTPSLVFASLWGEGVYISKDGGRQWSSSNEGLLDLHLRSDLYIDPDRPQTLYVGTWSGGLYGSSNEGKHWFPINSELKVVRTILSLPSRSKLLYVASLNGVFSFKPKELSLLDCIN